MEDFHLGLQVARSFGNKGHRGHNLHHMWKVPRNSLQCLLLLRLHCSLSPLITASRFHTRAQALKSTLSVRKRSTGKAFEPCEHRGKGLTAARFPMGGRGWAGIQGIQKYRAKAVAFEEGEHKESPCGENRAGCCKRVELWTLSSVCLPVSVLVFSPQASACMLFCSFLYLFFFGENQCINLCYLKFRDSFSSIKKEKKKILFIIFLILLPFSWNSSDKYQKFQFWVLMKTHHFLSSGWPEWNVLG